MSSGGANAGRIDLDLGLNSGTLQGQMQGLTGAFSKIFGKLTGMIDSAFSVDKIIDFTKSSIKLASDLDAHGDFSKISHSWTNEIRLMNDQWNTFMITMGQGFINILTPIITGLNYLIGKLQVAAQYFKAFTIALFGDHNSQQSTAGISNATASSDALGNSLDTTAEKAKKAKGALMGFDQINILNTNKDTGSDAASRITPVGGAASPTTTPINFSTNASEITQKIKDMADRVKAVLAAIFEPFKKSWERNGPTVKKDVDIIFGDIKTIAQSVGQTLKDIWTDPAVQSSVQSLCDIFTNIFTILTKIFDKVVEPAIKSFLDKIDPKKNPSSQNFCDGMDGALKSVKGLTDYLSGDGFKYVSDFVKIFAAFKATQFIVAMAEATIAIVANTGAWIANTASMIANAIAKTAQFISSTVKMIASVASSTVAFVANELILNGCTIATYACALATSVLGAALDFLGGPIGVIILVVVALTGAILYLWNHNKGFHDFVLLAWDNIKKAFSYFLDFMNGSFAPSWGKSFGFFGNILDGFMISIREIWNGVKEIFGGVVDFISGVFTGNWDKAWKGIKEIFKGVFDSLEGIAKYPLNLVIGIINGALDGVNTLIDALDSVKFDIPKLLGGGTFSLDIKKLSPLNYLAKGGVVNQPTLAMVGEAGKEAVMPLENNTGWINNLAGQLASRIGSGDNSEIVEVLKSILALLKNASTKSYSSPSMTESELARYIAKILNNETRRNGRSLLT